jgi:hypothetical protein
MEIMHHAVLSFYEIFISKGFGINQSALTMAFTMNTLPVLVQESMLPAAEGNAILETSKMKGLDAETWLGFLSNDEKDAGCSVCTGRIDL